MKTNSKRSISVTRNQYFLIKELHLPYIEQDGSDTTYGNGGYGAIINDNYKASYTKNCKKHIKENLKRIANELLDLSNSITDEG